MRLWLSEFGLCKGLIRAYSGHETIWLHRRFLIFHWMTELWPQIENKGLKAEGEGEEISYDSEISFAELCIGDSTAERFKAQREFALTYQFWVTWLKDKEAQQQSSLEYPQEEAIQELGKKELLMKALEGHYPQRLPLWQQIK